MSDLVINLDTTALGPSVKKRPEGASAKHRHFVRRRQFLERKGFLKPKQLPSQPPGPKREACQERPMGERGKRQKVDGRKVAPASTSPAEGSASRAKAPPKENLSRAFQDTPGASPAGAPAMPNKTGVGSARQNGAPAGGSSLRDISRAGLLGEYESGLPSASAKPSKMVAIDCEMVGTGPGGRNSDLARCSVVGYYGDVIYDKYVRPLSPITNYRTRWSGIRRHHMANAVPFKVAQKEILKILSGKIVVGHAIHNDFKALKYFHPKSLTRDTSKIPLLNRKAGFPENEAASLKRLTKQLLHRDIQVGQNGHSSVEDARATMELYKVIEAEWERHLATTPAQD
ncbi:interferon-stimulated 20 kDa exonuclease-like 2 [Pogona vitticeps]